MIVMDGGEMILLVSKKCQRGLKKQKRNDLILPKEYLPMCSDHED